MCAAQPGTTERLSHGEPTFFVDNQVYVMFANNHHNDGHVAVYVPTPPGRQPTILASAPGTYFKPPYVGGRGWIGIELAQVSDDDLRFHLTVAWDLVAGKRRPVRPPKPTAKPPRKRPAPRAR